MADDRHSTMEEPPEHSESAERSSERLDSWKEIAAYLNRDVTTAQRWEKREGMPVHRHAHERLGSVYAYRAELDAWARSRNVAAEGAGDGPETPRSTSEAPQGIRAGALSLRWLGLAVAALAVIAAGLGWWLQKSDYFWRNPMAGARFEQVSDWDSSSQAAALSRDGKFIAFLSDRDGHTDVWLTQDGSGEFHNLTRGRVPELVNPAIRPLAFSPDGSLVTFWTRTQDDAGQKIVSIWAVPTLGGEPRPYLEGAAELDWSPDGSQLAYHTTAPGDPLFISHSGARADNHPIFTAPAGLHCHFPLWAPNSNYIYFAEGTPPDGLNIWRIRREGGAPEHITSQGGVSYPVLLNERTLLYLATDAGGDGPWLYEMDVRHRIAHRLSFGPQRYTSLASSADGHSLAVTAAAPETTLWRMHAGSSPETAAAPSRISLTTNAGHSPRLGPNYLLYVSSAGTTEGIWKIANGSGAEELWRGEGAQIIGAPAISPGGERVAFSVLQQGRKLLYVMHADGSDAHVLAGSLDLQGDPAWTPDGQWVTSAANDHGVPHIYRVPSAGGAANLFLREYALDPAWAGDGRFVLYSGANIGTTFAVNAATADGKPYKLAALNLPRGARHTVLLRNGHSAVVLRGELGHKNLWVVNLETGQQRQMTSVPEDFNIGDFDISPDGKEIVLERETRRACVMLLDLRK